MVFFPISARAGGWDPAAYVMRSRDEQPVRVSGSASMDDGSPTSAITGQALVVRGAKRARNLAPQATGCYILPTEYSSSSEEPVVRFGEYWGRNKPHEGF
jgi:hypothetical protein